VVEAPPGLDGSPDDHQLGPALRGDAADFLTEAAGPRADDLAPDVDPVRARDRGRRAQALPQAQELPVEVRVERQLALEDRRRDENDPGAAIGGQPAGEIEGVLRLLPIEQRHHDAAVGDRARPAREAPSAAMEAAYVRNLHLMRWYGTEARITCGSTSSRRLT
jgi:hypothetical protein